MSLNKIQSRSANVFAGEVEGINFGEVKPDLIEKISNEDSAGIIGTSTKGSAFIPVPISSFLSFNNSKSFRNLKM